MAITTGAAVATSDNPYDATSHLDRPDVFRLSLGLPKAGSHEVVDVAAEHDPTALDVLFPHPVHGGQHWLCVLNPDRTGRRCRGCSRKPTRSPCASTTTPPGGRGPDGGGWPAVVGRARLGR